MHRHFRTAVLFFGTCPVLVSTSATSEDAEDDVAGVSARARHRDAPA
jgi:hypothetical protein